VIDTEFYPLVCPLGFVMNPVMQSSTLRLCGAVYLTVIVCRGLTQVQL